MKEWNGNKNSIAAQMGLSTTWHPEQRAKDDFYTTDPKALWTLANYFNIPKVVWEPACGTGNLSKVLEKICVKVYSSDLKDRGYGETGVDFLQCDHVPDGVTCIITNPPYKLANEFIEHAIEILPVNGTYIALMNLSYLAGKQRYREIYAQHILERIYIHTGRIHCYRNGLNHGGSSPVNYAWYLFRKPADEIDGLPEPPQIEWIE